MISGIADFLSAMAIVVAVWVWLLRRQPIQPVVWGWNVVGSEELPDGSGDRAHVFEVRNSGTGVAHILQLQVVGALLVNSPLHRARKTLGTGESFTLLVTAEDINETWFRVMWREQSNRARAKTGWAPVVWNTPLSSEWSAAHEARRSWPLLDRLRLWLRPPLVAPASTVSSDAIVTDVSSTLRTRPLVKAERDRWVTSVAGKHSDYAYGDSQSVEQLTFIPTAGGPYR